MDGCRQTVGRLYLDNIHQQVGVLGRWLIGECMDGWLGYRSDEQLLANYIPDDCKSYPATQK